MTIKEVIKVYGLDLDDVKWWRVIKVVVKEDVFCDNALYD